MLLKIELEKIILLILVGSLVIMNLYFVTPISDNYWQYLAARQTLRDPSFLWQTNITGISRILASGPIYQYPPLLQLSYAFSFLVGLTPQLIDVLSILIICYLLCRMDKRAIPIMLLSFLFIRLSVQGGIDIFMLMLALTSLYFFEKNPMISGILAGLTPLVKGTGFLYLGSWVVAVLIFKRKDVFNKQFFKSKYFLAIIISILVLSPWYLRNFIIFKGDIAASLLGFTPSKMAGELAGLDVGVQSTQPERYWFDTTGYYPVSIDILFYLGIIFTIFNLVKSKKVEKEHVFIGIFVFSYLFSQAISFKMIGIIRYYLPIFPLLAMQIPKRIPEKYLKFLYAFCLILLIFWGLSLQKYAWNQMDSQLAPVCKQIKSQIDFESVYVKAFQDLFIMYKCDLNATTQNDSKWTLDLEKGQLYLTNKTNITSG
jgi:hypothetical protein